jgi:hypothetical protein
MDCVLDEKQVDGKDAEPGQNQQARKQKQHILQCSAHSLYLAFFGQVSSPGNPENPLHNAESYLTGLTQKKSPATRGFSAQPVVWLRNFGS